MKKTLFLVLISYSLHLITNQKLPEDRTNELISFIQEKDQYLQEAQEFVNYFMKTHTYKTSETRGKTTYTYTHINPYTSYEIINRYYDAKRIIANFESKSTQDIQPYIKEINDTDKFGKTPLEYVKSSEMYNILRSHGAHFQLNPYMKTYPWSSVALFGTALLATAYILYNHNPLSLLCYYKSMQTITHIDTKNLEEQLAKKEIDLAAQDTCGRTFLINYLIQQNQELEILNQKIKTLPENSLELYQMLYAKANLIVTTEKNIKTMIEQNASTEIYDIFYKNCLSYCTIKELRHLFEKPSAFYNKDLIGVLSVYGLTGSIVAILLVISQPKTNF